MASNDLIFDTPAKYDDEGFIESSTERLTLSVVSWGLTIIAENISDEEGHEVDGASVVLSVEQAKTMLEFLKRHYGE